MSRSDPKSLRFALLGVLAAFGLSLGATEAPPQQLAPPDGEAANEFARLDANRDGRLARDELPPEHALQAQFESLDANRDGMLDAAEYARKV